MNSQLAKAPRTSPIVERFTVSVLDPLADRRWDEFVAGRAGASVHHLSAWQRILGEAYRYEPAHLALEDGDGRLRGVLPLVLKNGPISGRRMTSLPLVNQGGPLAESPVMEATLMASACRAADESGAVLRVYSRSGAYSRHLPVTDAVPASPTWELTLPDDLADLPRQWGKRRGNIMRYLRKGQAAGLTARETTREEDVRAFHELYLRTAKKHRCVPHSLRLFELMRRSLPRGVFQLVLIEQRGRVVAGAVNLVWRDLLEALFLGIDERCLDARPSHALHWETIRLASARGLRRINFGAARHGGSQAAFKAQWGAEPVSGFEFVYPPAPAPRPGAEHAARIWQERLATTVWTRTPLPVMGRASGLMYRYL